MAAKSRANLKAVFEDGDSPQGSDFEDLIDSFVSLTDTSAQSLASNLTVPVLGATTVSAGSTHVNGVATHQNSYIEAACELTAITSVEVTAFSYTLVSGALSAVNAARFSVSGHDIVYTDTVTAKYVVDCSMDVRVSAGQSLWVALGKNSTIQTRSRTQRVFPASGVAQIDSRCVFELKTGDVVNSFIYIPDGPIGGVQVFSVKYMVLPVYFG